MVDLTSGQVGIFGAETQAANAMSEQARLPSQIALTQNQANLTGAEAGLKQSELAMQQKFAQMAAMQPGGATGAGTTPDDMAKNIEQMARLALQAGQVQKAGELTEQAQNIRLKGVDMLRMQALMANTKMEMTTKQFDLAGQMYSGATDQVSFDKATSLLKMNGVDSPWAGMPFSQDLLKHIQDASMSVAQRVQRDTGEQRVQMANQALQLKTSQDQFLDQQRLIDEQRKTEQEERSGKSGGMGMPTKAQTDQTGQYLTNELGMDADSVLKYAPDVAHEINGLLKGNRGMTLDEAQAQAIINLGVQKQVTKRDYWADKTEWVKGVKGGQSSAQGKTIKFEDLP